MRGLFCGHGEPPGSGLIIRRGRWRPGGWQNGRHGTASRTGCKTPPVLSSGKEILDFVAPAIQPLVVMDWFLAAATGRNARRDDLLGQHLADFVPVIRFIPDHRGRRWGRRGRFLLWQTIWSLLVMPPWCHQSGGGAPPLLRLDAVGWAVRSVASSIRTSGSGASGGSAESDADNSEKIRLKTSLSHQRLQQLQRVLWRPGHLPSANPSE